MALQLRVALDAQQLELLEGAAQLIDGVYALSNETLGGLIPPTTWPRDSTKRASLHPCTVPVRWTGTAFELPLGEKFVCSADGPGFLIVD